MSRPYSKAKPYQRHHFGNLRAELEKLVDAHGDGWLEALGPLGEPLKQWVEGVVGDLGGGDRITTLRRTQVHLAAKTLLQIEALDRFIFSMPSIINRSRRQVFPIVMQRKELVTAFGRQCADIGMEKLDADADDLMEMLKSRYAKIPEGRPMIEGDT